MRENNVIMDSINQSFISLPSNIVREACSQTITILNQELKKDLLLLERRDDKYLRDLEKYNKSNWFIKQFWLYKPTRDNYLSETFLISRKTKLIDKIFTLRNLTEVCSEINVSASDYSLIKDFIKLPHPYRK